MDVDQVVQTVAAAALPILFAVTVHEAAHGYAARALGDTTAWALGRLTLNPLKHIDPIGTVLVPVLMLVFTGFVIGWAKPVPVNMRNLRRPRQDMALVAAAGPAANLAMAVAWAAAIWLGLALKGVLDWVADPLILMGYFGVFINVILMVLNLLPLPPLDGGRVLAGLVPARVSSALDRIEPYGLLIVILLLVTGLLGRVLGPPVEGIAGLLWGAAGLPT